LGEIAEEEPEAAIIALNMLTNDGEFGEEALLTLFRETAVQEGVNLPRVIVEHPDLVEDIWGIDPSPLSDLADRLDEALD